MIEKMKIKLLEMHASMQIKLCNIALCQGKLKETKQYSI